MVTFNLSAFYGIRSKLSSIFGTSAGYGVLRGYSLYESIDIYRKLKIGEVLGTMLAAVVIVPRTILQCLRQRKRWPWSDFDAHLQTPLCDLRAAFGIRVAHGGI